MTSKLISGTGLQLLWRYDKKPDNYKAKLLDDDGPAYILAFCRTYSRKKLSVFLALLGEMLSANPKRARLFHDKSLDEENAYKPLLRLIWNGSWFTREKAWEVKISGVS
ncbi:hypothetical protein OROHE_007933 [Orobanche hederae]